MTKLKTKPFLKTSLPEITVTISGDVAAGKTCLAHKLAGFLTRENHTVTLLDDYGVPTISRLHVAQEFRNSRKITINIQPRLERTCVQCGCSDSRACGTGCHWVEEHKHTPTGVCSQCATVEKFPEGIVMLRITNKSRRGKLARELGVNHLNTTPRL